MLVQEVLAASQLLVVEHDAKLKMTACLAKPSPDVLDLHPFMVPLSQDAEVRTWRGTYQPVRIVILANASCQIAMLFQIEIPNFLPPGEQWRDRMP